MEPGGEPFEAGKSYTRAQIAAALGGGARAVFPSREGRVVAICAAMEYNPRAPSELIAGPGAGHVRAARRLAAAGTAVPVFVRRQVGSWEYAGVRRVARVVEEAEEVAERGAEAARKGGSVLVVLEEVTLSGGEG